MKLVIICHFVFPRKKMRNLLNVTISQMSKRTGCIVETIFVGKTDSLGRAIIIHRKTNWCGENCFDCDGDVWSSAGLLLQRKLGLLWRELWLLWGLYKRLSLFLCCSVGSLCMDKSCIWCFELCDHFDKLENLTIFRHGGILWSLWQGGHLVITLIRGTTFDQFLKGDNFWSLWQGGQLLIALTRGTTFDRFGKGDNFWSLW